MHRNRNARGVRPQLLKPIEGARTPIHQVYDNIAAVHQHPLEVIGERTGGAAMPGTPLRMPHHRALPRQERLNVFLDGCDLWRAVRGTDDEEVGHRGERTQIENDEPFCLLLERCLGSQQRFGLALDGPMNLEYGRARSHTWDNDLSSPNGRSSSSPAWRPSFLSLSCTSRNTPPSSLLS